MQLNIGFPLHLVFKGCRDLLCSMISQNAVFRLSVYPFYLKIQQLPSYPESTAMQFKLCDIKEMRLMMEITLARIFLS